MFSDDLIAFPYNLIERIMKECTMYNGNLITIHMCLPLITLVIILWSYFSCFNLICTFSKTNCWQQRDDDNDDDGPIMLMDD